MIEVQQLNQHQLADFLASDSFLNMRNLPISHHRALSQLKNPRLEPEDQLLFLAWLQGEMVGYLGVMPDRYFLKNGRSERCGWLTCLWVSEQQRGKSIARTLIEHGVQAIGGQVLLTEFTPQAKQLYDRLGFFSDLQIRQGIRLYSRFELHRLLPPKHRFFEKTKPLWWVFDALGNVVLDLINNFRPSLTQSKNWSEAEEIDPEMQRFIVENQGNELFKRGQIELNWAIKNPWVLAMPANEMSRRYYFSSVDASFDFICVKICDTEMNLRALLVFTKRNRTLKLPYCYLINGAAPEVAEVIDWYIQHWGINTFSTYHPTIVKHYQTIRTFSRYKKGIKRHYIASEKMAKTLAGHIFEIQDGDGDCFFT